MALTSGTRLGPYEIQSPLGAGKPLFPLAVRGLSREYDVSHDGQRFLIITDNQGSSQSLTLVQNWLAEVKKK